MDMDMSNRENQFHLQYISGRGIGSEGGFHARNFPSYLIQHGSQQGSNVVRITSIYFIDLRPDDVWSQLKRILGKQNEIYF